MTCKNFILPIDSSNNVGGNRYLRSLTFICLKNYHFLKNFVNIIIKSNRSINRSNRKIIFKMKDKLDIFEESVMYELSCQTCSA